MNGQEEFRFEMHRFAWHIPHMTTIQAPIVHLRSAACEKIQQLTEDELVSVDRLLSLLELKRLRRVVGEAADQAIESGAMREVDEALRTHRSREPYR
jgi:hypothetical protein